MVKKARGRTGKRKKTGAGNANQPHARLKALIRLLTPTIQVSALPTFAPCEKTAARVVLGPLPAAPRAPAALSAASGQSPRTLGGFSVQTLASSGARSAMSPSGETPGGKWACRHEQTPARTSGELLSSFGGQLLTDRREVRCGGGGRWHANTRVAHGGCKVGSEVVFLDLWMGLRL
jgi:hypothetical protein